MKKCTFYNYLVVEENVETYVIAIECCYNYVWYDKRYYFGKTIKEAIKLYREEFNLKYKKLHIEKYTYSHDPNGLIMCY